MEHFDRKTLLQMQKHAYEYRMDSVKAWLIIAHIAGIILIGVFVYLISIAWSLMILACLLAADSIILLQSSILRHKIWDGKLLDCDCISVKVEGDNIIIYRTFYSAKAEDGGDDSYTTKIELDFHNVKKVYELPDIVYFRLKNRAEIKLPYRADSGFYRQVADRIGKRYKRVA